MLRTLLFACLVLFPACATEPSSSRAPSPTTAPEHVAAPAPTPASAQVSASTSTPAPASPNVRADAHEHTFVFLRTAATPVDVDAEKRNELMQGHMANIGRLANEHQLYVAGPFGTPNPDPALRGLFICTSADVSEVERLIQSDPSIAAGVFDGEVVPLTTSKDLVDVHRRDLEFAERRKADPSIDMMAGMSSYVLVFADDADRATSALAPLRSEKLVVLEGRFGGAREGQGVFILDARDPTAAEAMLEPVRSVLGTHRMMPWWGSAELRK